MFNRLSFLKNNSFIISYEFKNANCFSEKQIIAIKKTYSIQSSVGQIMKKQLTAYENLYKDIAYSKNGLTASDVEESRKKYGANILTDNKKITFMQRIISAITEPMVLILIFALLITVGVNIGNYLGGSEVDFFEPIGIFLSICVSVGLTVFMERKSEKAFETLKNITDNISVSVLRDGEKRIVSSSDVCVGDILFVDAGEKVVADCLILNSDGLEADESTLTGESVNVKKIEYKQGHIYENNILNSGTYIKSGSATTIVLAVGDSAKIGSIASGLSDNDISAPLAVKLTALSKKISIFGAISAVVVFALTVCRMALAGKFTFLGLKDAFVSAIVLLVAAVPEGLPTTVAISLALSVVRLAKSNAIIKKLVAAETVGCVSVICSDKTGTLTIGKMEVDCFVSGGKQIDGKNKDFRCFYKNIVYNSSASFVADGKNLFSAGNSTERALIDYLFKDCPNDLEKERAKARITDRLPFSSEKKYMSTTVIENAVKTTYIKGGIEVVTDLCGLDKQTRNRLISQAMPYENAAERVLAFARVVDNVYIYDGFCAITDKVRPEVIDSVKECKSAGIDVKILTGDNKETALAVAKKLGVFADENCLTGNEVDCLNDDELIEKLKYCSVVARCLPETKLRIVKLLKKSGEVVAVTGDGVNDAPAVKCADIGIAMGDGSEITKEASDIILLDNSFSVIVKAVSFGRNIYKNFQSFLFFQLTVNFSAVGLILAFLILGYAPPFTALQLLWINVIMDGPLALSLGLEKRSDEFLDEKPVKRTDDIVSKRSLIRIVLHSAYAVLIIVLQKIFNILNVEPFQSDSVIFSLFVLLQMFNAVNARELGSKSVFDNFWSNKLFCALLCATVCAQILFTQYCQGLFDTVNLDLLAWIKIILISGSVIVISESYKCVYRNVLKMRRGISKRRKFA